SITAINNVTNLFFRLVDADTSAANGGTVGSGGTDRVDNVIVTASPVPVPAAIWLLGSGLFGFAGLRRRQSAR
ncbi:VPLPA-CTERM sorting domain-containing protein, partial [Acinetobacter baumannii]